MYLAGAAAVVTVTSWRTHALEGAPLVTYRTGSLEDLDAFSAIGDAENVALVRKYLLSSMEAGESSPDWWFIAEEAGAIVGRIVFWSLPGSREVTLDVFALPWIDPARAAMAGDFLEHALGAIERDVDAVTYEHHEPDPEAHTPAALLQTLRSRGFTVARVTHRFELSPVPTPPPSERVRFVRANEEQFVQVIARCASEGEDTGVGDVEGFVADSNRMRGGSALWRIAYLDDEPVGVIFPTANDGGPVLNYIGVVPERRGRRLVDDLLGETARLQATHGAERLRADSDVDNVVMHRAFERAGWVRFGTRTTYALVRRSSRGRRRRR